MNRRALILCWCCLVAAQLSAAEVKIFQTDSKDAFLEGTLEEISVDPLGGVELAHRLELLTELAEPFVFSAAALDDGWVIGTGNEGRVLKVDRQGAVEVLYEASQLEVFAVLADRDGTIFAATSPYGKVVRIRGGEVEEIFDPPEAYIWDLARDSSGRLLVATGLEGRLYRLAKGEKPGAEAEVLIDANDRHLRVLEPRSDGSVLVGTAGQGMILRLDAKGAVSTLYDALQPEVLAFAATPAGTLYAALVASEASYVDLSSNVSVRQDGENGGGENGNVTVAVQGQETMGSRAAGASGPRSVVVEISPGGEVREVVSLADETVYSLLWHEDQLWIGTGQEGKLYRYADEHLVLERQLDDRQLTAMAKGRGGAAVLTTNPARLHLLAEGLEERGTYTSKILDASQPSRFGSLTWRGDGATYAEISARSGMSGQPDATWSSWSAAGSGGEVALGALPSGRYVQWRAVLKRDEKGVGPRLSGIELSYQQVNQKPELKSLEVLDPGEILVPSSFNPGNQTFEPWSPNREGIFTTLKPAESSDDGRLKTLWKKGYRTLRWEASDPNEDTLRYELEVRSEGAEDAWLPMVEELDEVYYSFDSTVLPDGSYRFRLRAWDRAAGELEAASAERLSTPVTVDHSPPWLVSVERRGESYEAVLEDALSPLRDVVYSVDAGEWRSVTTADGVLDGRRETVRLPVADGARMLLLRATDAGFNVITFDLLKAQAKGRR